MHNNPLLSIEIKTYDPLPIVLSLLFLVSGEYLYASFQSIGIRSYSLHSNSIF